MKTVTKKDEENFFGTLQTVISSASTGVHSTQADFYHRTKHTFDSEHLTVVQLHFNFTLETTSVTSRDSDNNLFFYEGAGDVSAPPLKKKKN